MYNVHNRQYINYMHIFVFTILLMTVNCDIFEECDGQPEGNFIASPKSCRHYIYCDGEESFEGECQEGDYFNDSEQICDLEDAVVCGISAEVENNNSSNNNNNNNNNNSNGVTGTTPVTIIATTLVGEGIATTIGADNNEFSTAAQQQITTISNTPSGLPSIIVAQQCPNTDNPNVMVMLPHLKSCSSFYICIQGSPKELQCSPKLYFNKANGKCDYPENVKCEIDFLSPKERCQSNVNDVFPHDTNCNYYYQCKRGYVLLQQCPFYYGWDYEKRTCVALNQAKCFNNANRW